MPSTQLKVSIQPILPKKDFTQKEIDTLFGELSAYFKGPLSKRIQKEFDATIKNWNHAPSFTVVYSEPYNKTRLQLRVRMSGKYSLNWLRVNYGTGPRMITSSKKLMTFNVGYDAKTQPGGKYGGSGNRYGAVVWKRRTVGPHRIRPRNFIKEITKSLDKDIPKELSAIAKKAIR